MSYALEKMIDRFAQRDVRRATSANGATAHAVVIRQARDEDAAVLADLAALVDDRVWAAHGIDDDRAIADPFVPSAEAAGLLRLRVRQLRAAHERAIPRVAPWRRLARRVG
jgi:hypothetical protein